MEWIDEYGLSKRIEEIPLILCGPILRRVELHSVSVFVALKVSCEVTLSIYKGNTKSAANLKFEGTRETVSLGKYLHVCVVTAKLSFPLFPLLYW